MKLYKHKLKQQITLTAFSNRPDQARRMPSQLVTLLSPESEMLGKTQMNCPQMPKRIQTYVKEHQLHKSSDKEYIHCDHAISSIRESKVPILTMNRRLSSHTSPANE